MAKINKESLKFIKKFYEEMEKSKDGEVTMTPEGYKSHVKQIWPGIRKALDKAVDEGRILYIKGQVDTEIEPKEISKDGAVHTVMKDQMAFLIIMKTEKKEVS